MSQRYVEILLGRLITDEELRRRFEREPDAVIDALIAEGLRLTPVERDALLRLDTSACDRFAERLDPRLVKARLRWPWS